MAILKLNDRHLKSVIFGTSTVFFALAVLYFLPVSIPHKIAFPLLTLFVSGLWVLPWQMMMAMLMSALGDYMGSCGNFIGQMSFFACAHIFMVIYLSKRYLTKVEHDGKLTAKAKGYLVMVLLCVGVLITTAIVKVSPCAPAGIIRTGVIIYAFLIGTMLLTALLQRSSLYALGAVLFVFSDFILAWNKFVEPIEAERYLIMVPYYMGQWLLFVRSTQYRVNLKGRLFRF